MKHNHGWRSAFTLIEMLTVTAIIAMLATALVSGLKSAQRQAHTALCQARMKNLHQACMNYLSDTGYYPYAGSYEWLDRSYQTYQERKGWVTWIRKDGKDTNPWAENNKVAHAKEYLYVGWDGENALRSVKEGSIFKYASRDTSVYFCKEFNEGKGDVRRSYAMNDWFGSRRNKLWRPRQLRNFQNDGIEPSRMGYIIELQSTETGVTQGDYDNSKPIAYDSVWEPDPNMKKERYGIWHRKSGDLHGHVIFVDGHIESLTATTNPQGDDYQTQNTKIRTGKH